MQCQILTTQKQYNSHLSLEDHAGFLSCSHSFAGTHLRRWSLSFSLLNLIYYWVCRKADPEDPIEKALLGLPKEGLRVLLEYIREWNTKPKFCHVAQFVLFRVLRSLPPTDILEVCICLF